MEGDVSTLHNGNEEKSERESVYPKTETSPNKGEKPIYIPIHLSTLISSQTTEGPQNMRFYNNSGKENFMYAPVSPAFPIEACKIFINVEIKYYFNNLLEKTCEEIHNRDDFTKKNEIQDKIMHNNSSLQVTSISISEDQNKVYIGRINGQIEEFQSLHQHILDARSYKMKKKFESMISSLI